MSGFNHSVGGPAPYNVAGTIAQGQSVCRPARGTGLVPATSSTVWRRPYPILPCRSLTWGDDGVAIHFSPVAPSKDAALMIYGAMTWAFYSIQNAFIFSIEEPVPGKGPWLNIVTSNGADWRGLDATHQRLVKAGTNLEQVVAAICDEVRP